MCRIKKTKADPKISSDNTSPDASTSGNFVAKVHMDRTRAAYWESARGARRQKAIEDEHNVRISMNTQPGGATVSGEDRAVVEQARAALETITTTMLVESLMMPQFPLRMVQDYVDDIDRVLGSGSSGLDVAIVYEKSTSPVGTRVAIVGPDRSAVEAVKTQLERAMGAAVVILPVGIVITRDIQDKVRDCGGVVFKNAEMWELRSLKDEARQACLDLINDLQSVDDDLHATWSTSKREYILESHKDRLTELGVAATSSPQSACILRGPRGAVQESRNLLESMAKKVASTVQTIGACNKTFMWLPEPKKLATEAVQAALEAVVPDVHLVLDFDTIGVVKVDMAAYSGAELKQLQEACRKLNGKIGFFFYEFDLRDAATAQRFETQLASLVEAGDRATVNGLKLVYYAALEANMAAFYTRFQAWVADNNYIVQSFSAKDFSQRLPLNEKTLNAAWRIVSSDNNNQKALSDFVAVNTPAVKTRWTKRKATGNMLVLEGPRLQLDEVKNHVARMLEETARQIEGRTHSTIRVEDKTMSREAHAKSLEYQVKLVPTEAGLEYTFQR